MFLDWIYKKKCYFCGKSKESSAMCSACYEKLLHLPVKVNRVVEGVNIYCAGEYCEELQKLIRGLKYHKRKDLAFYQAKFMYDYWKNLNFEGKFEVVPVPLHKKRQRKRKYNHMELVAKEFCRLTGFEENFDLIKRIKDTKAQYNLTKAQRVENLSGAFEITPNTDKKLLIIDDICTTGTTFEAIVKELKKHNITDIVCFATATPL